MRPAIDTSKLNDKFNSFYRAVVEENEDPEKRGRVRVRIWGLHTEYKTKSETEGIPVAELPWAEPALPIFEGGISGFGMFGVPVQGSHVMIFFENGNYFQPRYFASMPTMNPDQMPDKRLGFCDPDGTYPFKPRLSEPDWHRLGRGVSINTLVTTKLLNRILAVQAAKGGLPFTEPPSPYNAQYPHNWVFTTHGGLTLELDSTPGSKRFHLYHPSNTYIECDNDGNLVIRSTGTRHDLANDNSFSYTKGFREVSVDLDQGNRTGRNKREEVGVNKDVTILGSKTETIGGNDTLALTGNKAETIIGNKTQNITGAYTLNGTTTITISATGNVTIGGATVTLQGSSLILNFSGTSASTSTGAMSLTGSTIALNGSSYVHLNAP
jgi:hypothetical protein